MIRKAVAGLAALGLIGGAGHVVYDSHGTPTVKIKDASGVVHSATLKVGGRDYSCPIGESDKLEPYVEAIGRIKITQQTQPSRYDELVPAYNEKVDEYNAVLNQDCTT